MKPRQKPYLFKLTLEHYLLINDSNRYWDGSNWNTKSKAKHYPSLTSARNARSVLKTYNRIFKSSETSIERCYEGKEVYSRQKIGSI